VKGKQAISFFFQNFLLTFGKETANSLHGALAVILCFEILKMVSYELINYQISPQIPYSKVQHIISDHVET
jgi:hypothetical protein